MAGHHKAHHGHMQPVPSTQHAAKHDKQMAAIDDEHARHASSTRMEDAHHHVSRGGNESVGGSAHMTQGGRGAGLPNGSKGDTSGLKKVAAGRLETAKGQ